MSWIREDEDTKVQGLWRALPISPKVIELARALLRSIAFGASAPTSLLQAAQDRWIGRAKTAPGRDTATVCAPVAVAPRSSPHSRAL